MAAKTSLIRVFGKNSGSNYPLGFYLWYAYVGKEMQRGIGRFEFGTGRGRGKAARQGAVD